MRSPRSVLILFLVVTGTPAAALAWLGWRLYEQDRALEGQQVQERLERAADVVTATLERLLSETASQLPAVPGSSPDALVVTFTGGTVEAQPAGRLLYYPAVPASREASGSLFAAAEDLELRLERYPSAIAAYQALSRNPDPQVRAAALVRLGRTLRKNGRLEEALAAYDRLAALGAVRVGGTPGDLLASQARCAVLQRLGRTAELQQAARLFEEELHGGRWTLDRATFGFYAREADRWLAGAPDRPADDHRPALALAAAVESLWELWPDLQHDNSRRYGRRSVWVHDQPVLLLWDNAPERLTALIAGSQFLDQQWGETWRRLDVSVALVDADSHLVVGQAAPAGQPQAVRSQADTSLPWTVRVSSGNPAADRAQLAGRRRLLLTGLAMVGLVVVAGTYFTVRALTRELAVARLQSDFVSAVSHEFRTPLTSIRHLTDLLDRGVVTEEDRRRQYYSALSHETTRLHRLVEGLLNFGRMEAGALEYRPEVVSPGDLVEDVVGDFRKETAAAQHRIELRVDADVPLVRVDREAVSRALWNLLDNAVKYSPVGSLVRVELAREGDRVAFCVSDSGQGVPAAEQKEIFKKFVRGRAARTSNVKGTGVGLAMVQHTVRAHGGEVRLDSQPGRGSTFTIVLPGFRSRDS